MLLSCALNVKKDGHDNNAFSPQSHHYYLSNQRTTTNNKKTITRVHTLSHPIDPPPISECQSTSLVSRSRQIRLLYAEFPPICHLSHTNPNPIVLHLLTCHSGIHPLAIGSNPAASFIHCSSQGPWGLGGRMRMRFVLILGVDEDVEVKVALEVVADIEEEVEPCKGRDRIRCRWMKRMLSMLKGTQTG